MSTDAEQLNTKLQSWLFEADFFSDMISWATPRARNVVDLKTGENSLAMTALHQEFESYFETKLEKFCLDAGASAEDVHSQLEAAIKEGGDQSSQASSVVDFIVALADFDLFSQMMRDIAKQAEANSIPVVPSDVPPTNVEVDSSSSSSSSSTSSSSGTASWTGSTTS
jgi:hypothetical protein